jgi:hypothetical protein
MRAKPGSAAKQWSANCSAAYPRLTPSSIHGAGRCLQQLIYAIKAIEFLSKAYQSIENNYLKLMRAKLTLLTQIAELRSACVVIVELVELLLIWGERGAARILIGRGDGVCCIA